MHPCFPVYVKKQAVQGRFSPWVRERAESSVRKERSAEVEKVRGEASWETGHQMRGLSFVALEKASLGFPYNSPTDTIALLDVVPQSHSPVNRFLP